MVTNSGQCFELPFQLERHPVPLLEQRVMIPRFEIRRGRGDDHLPGLTFEARGLGLIDGRWKWLGHVVTSFPLESFGAQRQDRQAFGLAWTERRPTSPTSDGWPRAGYFFLKLAGLKKR
jgi:hypothetical protein